MRPQRLLAGHGGARRALFGHDVGQQPRVAASVLADHGGGVADAGMLPQHLLDLAELDPVAPELHLVVDAAEELQVAAGTVADEVAGTVRAPAGRIGDEPVIGQLGPAEVAGADTRAADQQLTGGAERRGRSGARVHDTSTALATGRPIGGCPGPVTGSDRVAYTVTSVGP